MNTNNNDTIKKLVTHNGSFHSDDIFATATLSIVLEKEGQKFEVIRTRDPEIIKSADYVYDVGGIYDEATNRFDHHQIGGAGKNEFGIEFSSFGLVWKKFGVEICGSQKVADAINKKLVAPVDAHDNGVDLVESKDKIFPYFIQSFLERAMLPTWKETNLNKDDLFLETVEIAKKILSREIVHARDRIFAEELVTKIYQSSPDKKILVFDTHYPVSEIFMNFPETLYVISPRDDGETWGIMAIRDNPKSFQNRKDFPSAWAGLRDEELQKTSGVPDAVFCHRNLFLAVAKSREGAIKLAQIALQS